MSALSPALSSVPGAVDASRPPQRRLPLAAIGVNGLARGARIEIDMVARRPAAA